MIDLISRKAAIDAFYHIKCNLQMMDDSQTADKMMHGLWLAENAIKQLPSAQPEIIRCEDCMHNGSFDTDCPIEWNGKEYCSFAERKDDECGAKMEVEHD